MMNTFGVEFESSDEDDLVYDEDSTLDQFIKKHLEKAKNMVESFEARKKEKKTPSRVKISSRKMRHKMVIIIDSDDENVNKNYQTADSACFVCHRRRKGARVRKIRCKICKNKSGKWYHKSCKKDFARRSEKYRNKNLKCSFCLKNESEEVKILYDSRR